MTGNYMLPGDHTRHLHPPHHPSAYNQSSATTRLPSNHSTSPHDQAKLDKKRERNRIAASKCRQRKLEKIQTLGEIFQNPICTFKNIQILCFTEEQLYRSKKEHEEKDRVIKRLQEALNFHVQNGCSIESPTDLDVRKRTVKDQKHAKF